MDGFEILDKLKHYIDIHSKLGCSVYQSHYKNDYFTLFREAHDNDWFDTSAQPRLTGDAIRDYFYGDWLAEENEKNNKRSNYLNMVLRMWDEWHYALERYGV